MSRETDSSSSGPQGRGGAAYPSGTPPYGSRPFPSLHPQERAGAPDDGAEEAAAAAAPAADEPRTETTLTTRIRINIPGSRPIPPVVVRTTVDDAGAAAAAAESPAPAPAAPEPEAPAEPEPEKTSDWFAPRKPSAAPPPSSPLPAASPYGRDESTGGMPLPFGEGGAPSGAPASPYGQDDSTGGMPLPFGEGGVPSGAPASPYGQDESTGGMPLPFGENGAPLGQDEATGNAPLPVRNPGAGRAAPTSGSSTPGSLFGVAPGESTAETPYLPPPVGSAPGEGEAARGPHDTPAGGFATPFANEAPPFGAGSPFDTGATPQPSADAPPFGAGSPFDTGATPAVDGGRSPYDTGSQPFGTADFPPGVPRPSEQPFPGGEGAPAAPYGPTAGPATGSMNVPPLTPEAVQPPTGPNGFRPPAPRGGSAPVSGDTLVSGIPTVPSGESRPPRQAPPRANAPVPGAAPVPPPAPARTAPAAKPAAPAAAKPAKKKGRSKPVLLGVAVGGVLVVAYGAGLLMNHADVPKGTTVLGVDIGNQNRDAAVKMLDTALGNRATAPIELTVGGKKQVLKPSVAGLSIDTDATVREVAHADYNPVSVIGSLFGGSRTSDPVFVVDEDKLKAALQTLAGSGSSGTDAMVRFEDGKAVGVPGTPRRTLDVVAATAQVEAAYRTRVETGTDAPVALNATTVPPKVSQAELDKAVNGFGKTAMSGKVTVRSDAAHSIPFKTTVPQFLTMVSTPDGKLTPHIDLKVLKGLYGSQFDGVLLKRSDGSKTPVTPQDVATALIKALGAPDAADRTVTLPNVV
nr:hypothetical protein OH826_26135 [Streptomyces sp. NBC_00899]